MLLDRKIDFSENKERGWNELRLYGGHIKANRFPNSLSTLLLRFT